MAKQTSEEYREKRKARYQENLEINRERARAYYAAHIEERRAYDKERYGEKLERSREWRKNHYQNNKESKNAYAKEYAQSERGREVIRKRLQRPEVQERGRQNQRRWMLMNYYGMTVEDYDAILSEQNGVCAICGQAETSIDARSGNFWPLAVDHDHTTGIVRGLLCRRCNIAIGSMEDKIELMHAAIVYLDKFRT